MVRGASPDLVEEDCSDGTKGLCNSPIWWRKILFYRFGTGFREKERVGRKIASFGFGKWVVDESSCS